MRKSGSLAALVLVALVGLAAPAHAQRDPFDPVIDPNAATTTTGDTTATTTGAVGDPTVPGSIGSERLADTGADVTPFLAVAFALLALGGIALALARLHGPPAPRS